MDARRLTLAIAISFLIFALWSILAARYGPKPPPKQPAPESSATQPAGPGAASAPAATDQTPRTIGETQPATPATKPSRFSVVGASGEQTVTLGFLKPDGPYRMAVVVTNAGAAINRIQLSDFKQVVDRPDPYTLVHPIEHNGVTFRSMATQSVRLVDYNQTVELHDVFWNLRKIEEDGTEKAELWVQIDQDEQPAWKITKTYSLTAATMKQGGYDLRCDIDIENLGSSPGKLTLVEGGPVGMTQEGTRQDQRKIVAATYDDSGAIRISRNHIKRHRDLASKGPFVLGSQFRQPWLAWAADSNKFFTCLMYPLPSGEGQEAKFIDVLEGVALFGEKGHEDDLSFRWTSAEQTIAPGRTREMMLEYFCGPRKKSLLTQTPKYAERNYYALVRTDFVWCGGCSFGWLAGVMIALLQGCHQYIWPHNYGLAIIIMVLLVRIVLHPITKFSQVHMLKMQKNMAVLAPMMEEAKKKYANDRKRLNEEMMKVYREAGINPMGQMFGCLPMALQMPIWVALWMSLNTTVELRHAPFILWIRDLSTPDALVHFSSSFHIPVLSGLIGPVTSFNLMPILLGVFMFLQQRFMSPKMSPLTVRAASKKSADQMAQQKKMMSFMTIFFGVLFYNMPSGLTTYIMTSSFFGMIEQWRIRKHAAEKEKLAEAAPGGARPAKAGRLRAWAEALAKRADEARELRSDKRKKHQGRQ